MWGGECDDLVRLGAATAGTETGRYQDSNRGAELVALAEQGLWPRRVVSGDSG